MYLVYIDNMMNSTPGLPNFVPNHLTFTTEPLNVDVNMESINEICNFDDQAARKPFMKRRGPSDGKLEHNFFQTFRAIKFK